MNNNNNNNNVKMKENAICEDIQSCMNEYLSVLDKYNMAKIYNRDFNMKEEFMGSIKVKLGKFIEDVDDFLRKLEENNCVISGSFILDCLYGTDYCNDIDIIKVMKADRHFGVGANGMLVMDEFMEYLHKIGAKSVLHTRDMSDSIDHQVTTNLSRYILLQVRDYEIKSKKIQVIFVTKNVPEYIENVFDMDICKNYFDGKTLYIKNIDKLVNKYDFYKPINAVAKYLYRHDHNDTNHSRIDKYRDRGFNIMKHPQYSHIENTIKKYVDTYQQFVLTDRDSYDTEIHFNNLYQQLQIMSCI